MSILSERDRHVLAVGIEQMTINGVTRRQRQFQFILRGTPPTQSAACPRSVNGVSSRRFAFHAYICVGQFIYIWSFGSLWYKLILMNGSILNILFAF
jgi:hypothetical protein